MFRIQVTEISTMLHAPFSFSASIVAFALFSLAPIANGAIIFTIAQTGGAVNVTADGSLDLSGLISFSTNADANGANRLDNLYFLGAPEYILASASTGSDRYTFSSFSQFGSPGPGANLVSDPFQEFGYTGTTSANGVIFVTRNYVGGSLINFSVDLAGGTMLSDFGFVPGESWGATFSTATGTDTITYSVAAVPEPSSLMLFASAFGTALVLRRRTR
jgi:PEP-CTERM motif